MHCGHSEELPGFLLEEEVPAPPLGSAHLPETRARPAGPPGLQPAAGGEDEEGGGGGAPQEEGGDGEVGYSSTSCSSNVTPFFQCLLGAPTVMLFIF